MHVTFACFPKVFQCFNKDCSTRMHLGKEKYGFGQQLLWQKQYGSEI